ncbi:MAG: hypothetical protein CMG35_04550 [Candidatus Marinimicrobia bacterium]|jgi:hypothetical protein|nr:hypothetical protein [Candidatus Neomarinimicrobiota bacterium]|tara:strand:- start:3110 stop:3841 length:732 start_codon:yes stop_codon:yes gene_type:complete
MKDILQDVVAKTHALGFLTLVKVNSEADTTTIESMAEDRSVILNSTTHNSVSEFNGTFGMPNLDKLALHLKNPEYQKDAKIDVVNADRNGETIPTHIHFENASGDFENDYRFMNKQIIDEKLKSVKFKGAAWNVTFQPSVAAIGRMKLQSAAHAEEPTFNVSTKDGDLVFSFGDQSTHAGTFVFEAGVEGTLAHTWSWPVAQVQAILNLDGDITMSISDQGAMQISVDSGLAKYDYILPAQSK